MKRRDGQDDSAGKGACRVSRRDFLKAAALTVVGSRIPADGPFSPYTERIRFAIRFRIGDMARRRLGRTDLMISEIGLGGSPPPPEPVFRKAIEMGVNYVDTSSSYSGGNSERLIGRVIKGRRAGFHIATKVHFHPGGGYTRYDLIREAEGSLERLQTDYVDVLLVHNVSSAQVVEHEEVLAAFETLKRDGKIRYTGISCHQDPAGVLTPAIRCGRYDMIAVAYNAFSGTYGERNKVYEDYLNVSGIDKVLALAKARDVGVVAMKTMAGGQRQNLDVYRSEGVSLPQAKLKWALANEAVSSVITEMDTYAILEENLSASGKRLSAREEDSLMRHVRAAGRDVCRMCGSCVRGCPSGIAIPDILRCLQYCRDHGKSGPARRMYGTLPRPHTAGGCNGCGTCERICPFGVRIVHHLREADRILA